MVCREAPARILLNISNHLSWILFSAHTWMLSSTQIVFRALYPSVSVPVLVPVPLADWGIGRDCPTRTCTHYLGQEPRCEGLPFQKVLYLRLGVFQISFRFLTRSFCVFFRASCICFLSTLFVLLLWMKPLYPCFVSVLLPLCGLLWDRDLIWCWHRFLAGPECPLETTLAFLFSWTTFTPCFCFVPHSITKGLKPWWFLLSSGLAGPNFFLFIR